MLRSRKRFHRPSSLCASGAGHCLGHLLALSVHTHTLASTAFLASPVKTVCGLVNALAQHSSEKEWFFSFLLSLWSFFKDHLSSKSNLR